jgi:hypothetical protein
MKGKDNDEKENNNYNNDEYIDIVKEENTD